MRRYFIKVPRWARNIYPKAIWNVHANSICWTFDDGPHPDSTPQLLQVLKENEISATFFMTGQAYKKFPNLVTQIRAEGHVVGSHGYAHLDGWKTSTKEYITDVQRSLEIIETKLFRPPFGRMTFTQYHRLSKMCDIYMWSIMPGDFDNNVSHNELGRRISKSEPGDIVVLHDTPFAVKRYALSLRNIYEFKNQDRM